MVVATNTVRRWEPLAARRTVRQAPSIIIFFCGCVDEEKRRQSLAVDRICGIGVRELLALDTVLSPHSHQNCALGVDTPTRTL